MQTDQIDEEHDGQIIWNDEHQYQAELERRVRLRLDASMAAERKQFTRVSKRYKSWLYLTSWYGFLVTWFAGICMPGFQESCCDFGRMITESLFPGMLLAIELPARAAHLADLIQHDAWSSTVYWAVLLAICGTSILGIRWCVGRIHQFLLFYRQYMADWISLEVALISVAAAVFFAEAIQSFGINAIVMILLTNAFYTTGLGISLSRGA